MKKLLTLVVGARPNFVKAAPLMETLQKGGRFDLRLIHTGQHFDDNMSKVFFEQLGMPQPDEYLDIHDGGPAEQIGRVMLALENEFRQNPPEIVIVFGDVNSTMAAAVTANKLNLKLAHVEAGLRSFDRSMPEEHNRIVTDLLSDFLFTPSKDADENLMKAGIPKDRIYFVGNIMVDSMLRFKPIAEKLHAWETYGLRPGDYGLVTLHRPSNVDKAAELSEIVSALVEIQKELPLLFPVHPRSRKQLEQYGLLDRLEKGKVQVLEPLGYLEFLSLMTKAKVVLTDSGGVQEETTVLGIPCLTVRNNTERPITITMGTNRLVGGKKEGILAVFRESINQSVTIKKPELWDGKSSLRMEKILTGKLG
jgi:UDP-N-acetylglucosamine 2-epimerase (non-hydrolysing)